MNPGHLSLNLGESPNPIAHDKSSIARSERITRRSVTQRQDRPIRTPCFAALTYRTTQIGQWHVPTAESLLKLWAGVCTDETLEVIGQLRKTCEIEFAKVHSLCKVGGVMTAKNFQKNSPIRSRMAAAVVPFELDQYPSLIGFLEGETSATSFVEIVYDEILIQIIRGEISSGTELKSTRIADEMKVSRTPVVQALARLLADGIVTQQTNHRAVVRPGAENWLVDIHELRQQIEPAAAKAAAGRISGNVKSDLQSLATDAQATSRPKWRTATRYFDYALHLAIAEFCGNLAVRESIRKCWMYKRVSYDAVIDSDEFLEREFDEHMKILHCLDAGNGSATAKAMRDHLRTAAEYRVDQRIV